MFMPFQEGLIIYVILIWGCCLGQYFDIKHCCLLFKALCIYWTKKKIFSFKYINKLEKRRRRSWEMGTWCVGPNVAGVFDHEVWPAVPAVGDLWGQNRPERGCNGSRLVHLEWPEPDSQREIDGNPQLTANHHFGCTLLKQTARQCDLEAKAAA